VAGFLTDGACNATLNAEAREKALMFLDPGNLRRSIDIDIGPTTSNAARPANARRLTP
jgi:hypothetical protein